MNILFLSSWFPYPPDNGIRQRTYQLLRGLAEHHDITLVTFGTFENRSTPSQGLEFCSSVHVVIGDPYGRKDAWKRLRGWFSMKPRFLLECFDPRMATQIEAAVKSQHFDLCIVSLFEMAVYVDWLECIPLVFEHLEIKRLGFQNDSHAPSLSREWARRRKLKRSLKQFQQRFALMLVPSEQERELIAQVISSDAKLAVLPNGVELDPIPVRTASSRNPTLIYNGAVTFYANYEAVDYFVRHILPLIREAEPAVELLVTGSYGGVEIETLSTMGARFTGFLDDIRGAVASADVCIVPLQSGGGTRLKILEAMSVGTPVVSTKVGAEGLEVQHGKHLLVADTEEDFARAVVMLLRNPGEQVRLSRNARRLVEQKYGWDFIRLRLEGLLEQVADRGTKSRCV